MTLMIFEFFCHRKRENVQLLMIIRFTCHSFHLTRTPIEWDCDFAGWANICAHNYRYMRALCGPNNWQRDFQFMALHFTSSIYQLMSTRCIVQIRSSPCFVCVDCRPVPLAPNILHVTPAFTFGYRVLLWR